MIHICFALYDATGRYSKFTGTAMLSIFENTDSAVTVHILCDNTLSVENRNRLIHVAEKYNQRVEFYNVEELCAEKLAEIAESIPAVKDSRVSIATFYRFLIPKLFPTDLEKIIYLDSDIIVNLDIAELWQIELGDKPFAAAPEIEADFFAYRGWTAAGKYLISKNLVAFDDYFNAGVLVINLKFFRNAEELIMSGIRFYASHPQCDNFDQDILNYLFSKQYLKLPAKFDHFVSDKRFTGHTERADKEIYHYVIKNLQMDLSDPFNRLWLEYFAKTPWFEAETIGRLYEGIRQIYKSLKIEMIQLTAMMSGKTRVFVVRKGDVENIKTIFAVRDYEEIITADKYIPCQEIFEKMNASRGKKLFFIFVPDFPFVNFEKLGFVQNRDFLDGFEFLSEAQGVPLNSHQILKAM